MKKQTFISYTYNEKGDRINFERWGYKTARAVEKALYSLFFGRYASTYGYLNKKDGANYIEIYEAPEEIRKETFIKKITLEELKKLFET
jgi:hypothetical protein